MEIKKIYELWSEEKTANPKVLKEGRKILEILYEVCSEKDRENISSHVIEYGLLIEKEAFVSGYIAAFNLWVDILKNPDLKI